VKPFPDSAVIADGRPQVGGVDDSADRADTDRALHAVGGVEARRQLAHLLRADDTP